ncbi:hypothetical protein EPI10_021457 [Gossypium australe]|uniref:Uncharacterized protein n=1 Tax=Gossypium australe TaxID=47621 RepID=A0A5B6WGP7_9ROSI|nr:hypothetical protein EPI10_021457 [Gossypium australe]
MIQMIQNNLQFRGVIMENLNQHLKRFIQLCDTFNFNGVIDEPILLTTGERHEHVLGAHGCVPRTTQECGPCFDEEFSKFEKVLGLILKPLGSMLRASQAENDQNMVLYGNSLW